MMQFSKNILMVRPSYFGFNKETSSTNFYQTKQTSYTKEEISEKAMNEFDAFVFKLRKNGLNVLLVNDLLNGNTPDSIFPNNWVSFHSCGKYFLYPMFAPNRRRERRQDILQLIQKNFGQKELIDFSIYETQEKFLEGTGSMVLDRVNKVCYAAISSRTNVELVFKFCEELSYTPCVFHAYQLVNNKRELIYHTNVMMSIADKYVVICLDCVESKTEKKQLLDLFEKTNKEVIEISINQKLNFAGNVLQVYGYKPFLAMSSTAFTSLSKNQIKKIERYNSIVHSPLKTIELIGGGSARCMMAEVF